MKHRLPRMHMDGDARVAYLVDQFPWHMLLWCGIHYLERQCGDC